MYPENFVDMHLNSAQPGGYWSDIRRQIMHYRDELHIQIFHTDNLQTAKDLLVLFSKTGRLPCQ